MPGPRTHRRAGPGAAPVPQACIPLSTGAGHGTAAACHVCCLTPCCPGQHPLGMVISMREMKLGAAFSIADMRASILEGTRSPPRLRSV